MTQPLIEARELSKRFTTRLDIAERVANLFGAGLEERTVHAVDGVSLAIRPGEVLGLVGESGCGKSTLGRVLAGIHPSSSGDVFWEGRNVAELSAAETRQAQLAAQMIFQDPMSSLNPRKTVAQAIGEAPLAHGMVRRGDVAAMVADLMERVGLDPSYARRYPHQFSGGQRQRIGIARALAVQPRFLICDESVSALDVSIQAQILNLFMDLRAELGLTYLFISHDLGVVKHISDRVAIMYLGRIVESADADEFFARPNHPYTQALLAEMPTVKQRRRVFQPVKGEIPSPLHPPSGCHFHPRCPYAFEHCRIERPALREIAPGHVSACHLNDAPPTARTTNALHETT
ncbi:MAG: ATP-binding cassette domain-containing protein [Alphaproteobacteria bacterium]|nr:ATP-binding cassette domain-containing protein [Alphaproteobacteria bacterium]MBU1560148.1 ATP-binding cassette domain-containing protein [Alphaproteobacteria bacterium]MBU2301887.1 ATP-binding cassette domain-containing protein [Alphaproteobacteria bacterium]MBU2368402.1 ATP-binding cassette domain-containing protein [Alphaproteobacteria bacterium]